MVDPGTCTAKIASGHSCRFACDPNYASSGLTVCEYGKLVAVGECYDACKAAMPAYLDQVATVGVDGAGLVGTLEGGGVAMP